MSIQDLEEALKQLKVAETLSNNEDQSTVGMTNLYPNPEDRPSHDIDAPWGESPNPKGAPNDAVHYGTGVKLEFHQDRESLLDRIFDVMPQASNADKALIAQSFERGKPGQHEAHSPLLTRKTAAQHVPDAPTLAERVRAVAGRR